MRIAVQFFFKGESHPAAITGVEGDVTDMILPTVGDLIRHSDGGKPFVGRVSERTFDFQVSQGEDVDGAVTVTLALDRVAFH